jgi:hypothetical protein
LGGYVLINVPYRLVYQRMAAEKKNNKRPFDMAVSDYFKGNNLISRN